MHMEDVKLAKNDLLLIGGIIIVLATVAYHILIPETDRKMLFTKYINRGKWDSVLMACRNQCKTTDLSCVDPCIRDSL